MMQKAGMYLSGDFTNAIEKIKDFTNNIFIGFKALPGMFDASTDKASSFGSVIQKISLLAFDMTSNIAKVPAGLKALFDVVSTNLTASMTLGISYLQKWVQEAELAANKILNIIPSEARTKEIGKLNKELAFTNTVIKATKELYDEEQGGLKNYMNFLIDIERQKANILNPTQSGAEDRIVAGKKSTGETPEQAAAKLEAKLKKLEASLMSEEEIRKLNFDNNLILLNQFQQTELDHIKTHEERLLKLKEKFAKLKDAAQANKIREELSQANLLNTSVISLVKDGEQEKTKAYGESFQKQMAMGANHSRSAFEMNKAIKMSDAFLSGAMATMHSYEFGTKIGGPVLGVTFAAMAAGATGGLIAGYFQSTISRQGHGRSCAKRRNI